MALDPKLVVWLLFSLVAVLILSRMMDNRRAKLAQLLQAYVKARVQWTKKRAKAARLAQHVAGKKATEEADQAIAMQAMTSARGPTHAPTNPAPAAEGRQASVPAGST